MGPGVPPPLSAQGTPPGGDAGAPGATGIGPSHVALPPGAWLRTLDFLAERFAHVPRATWVDRMARGEVRDAHGQALAPDAPYRAHQRLSYFRAVEDEAEPDEPAALIHRDEHLLVLDKPHFLPVVPSGRYLRGTALAQARRLAGSDAVAPVHRIDRETAGLVMFALQPATRGIYQALFREHRVHKTYLAVAPSQPRLALPLVRKSRIGAGAHFLQQCEQAGEPNACTRIDRAAEDGDWALYRLEPRTGRRHQLRLHMAALGLPIRHDRIYPVLEPVEAEDRARPLQLLAAALRFTDPLSGRAMEFQSRRQLAFAPAGGAEDALSARGQPR